jgi:hypothetical protein
MIDKNKDRKYIYLVRQEIDILIMVRVWFIRQLGFLFSGDKSVFSVEGITCTPYGLSKQRE